MRLPGKFQGAGGMGSARRRQAALWRYLAMLPPIGHNSVPDLDGFHLQGVQSDSLESLKVLDEWQAGETAALRAFLRAQRSQLYYIYCNARSYIIYFMFYNTCVGYKG
jgi:hypothetical protein